MFNYLGQCDVIRRTPEGELFWAEMMESKKAISLGDFCKAVNTHSFDAIDWHEGETLSDYIRDDETSGFYESLVHGRTVYFFQTCGFEFIFIEQVITLKDMLHEVKMNGLYDGWGVCLGWLFGLADYMIDQNIDIPKDWEHVQGLCGCDTESYEYRTLTQLQPSDEVTIRLAAIMWRYRCKLIAANKNY